MVNASLQQTPLKIAVMGAGAVGCYYGGMLARAGHNVVLIARPPHVEAIAAHGLRFETDVFDEAVRVRVSAEPAAIAGAQLVLFCVKSPDTETAAALMRPYLAADTLVLSLQNGVDNTERLRQVLPGTAVAAAVVYVAVGMVGPGHLRHFGRGDLVIEAPPVQSALSGEVLAQVLAAADVPTQVSADVPGALWAKLILNCVYNGASAITQMPYGQLVQGQGVKALMRDVTNECLAVAAAQGVTVTGDAHAAVEQLAVSMAGQLSSTARDLARGKPSEIDYLNGLVVRQGEALGIAVPVNRVLWALVKLLESKQA